MKANELKLFTPNQLGFCVLAALALSSCNHNLQTETKIAEDFGNTRLCKDLENRMKSLSTKTSSTDHKSQNRLKIYDSMRKNNCVWF